MASPSTAVMTQMNTRLERDLKQRGDAVLAQAGFSPSEAVRALWEFAAAHEHEPSVVAQSLTLESPSAEEERQRRIQRKRDSLNGLHATVDDFHRRFSMTPEGGQPASNASDEMPYEQALWERYEERGLL